jgi:thiamine-monophosphate kinase
MDLLKDIGEHEAIRRLTAMLGDHPRLVTGTGDDCAVVELPGSGLDQVFTTDPVIEGTHFLPGEAPERIGNKAAGRVLSDLAAMGAEPNWLLVNVVARPDGDIETIERIYRGMTGLCDRFGARIIGGDIAQGTALELHVFGSGMLPHGTALLRSGAGPGDAIVVTGPLGCSRRGKHLDFVPRVAEGLFLRESGLVHSMMDISDGLATDLRHILKGSGVGCTLDAQSIPANRSLDEALFDGEDFELLLTVDAAQLDAVQEAYEKRFGSPLHEIGRITDQPDAFSIHLADGSERVLSDKAFEHFKG